MAKKLKYFLSGVGSILAIQPVKKPRIFIPAPPIRNAPEALRSDWVKVWTGINKATAEFSANRNHE